MPITFTPWRSVQRLCNQDTCIGIPYLYHRSRNLEELMNLEMNTLGAQHSECQDCNRRLALEWGLGVHGFQGTWLLGSESRRRITCASALSAARAASTCARTAAASPAPRCTSDWSPDSSRRTSAGQTACAHRPSNIAAFILMGYFKASACKLMCFVALAACAHLPCRASQLQM